MHYKRVNFNQLDFGESDEPEEESLTLGSDYFSYALFAFYNFEEEK